MPDFRLAALVAAALCACAPCDLEDYTDKLTGPDATDCDPSVRGTDRDPAVDCVVAAFREHRAFRLEVPMRGIDSEVATAYVGDSAGNVYHLNWNSGTNGGRGTITRLRCVNPHLTDDACGEAWHLQRNDCVGTTLTCDSLEDAVTVCQ